MISYLDAGTGSILIQIAAGGMASLYAYMKYRAGFLRRLGRKSPESTESGPSTADVK